jgi:WhiB family redox-sensing transcriptional regulator
VFIAGFDQKIPVILTPFSTPKPLSGSTFDLPTLPHQASTANETISQIPVTGVENRDYSANVLIEAGKSRFIAGKYRQCLCPGKDGRRTVMASTEPKTTPSTREARVNDFEQEIEVRIFHTDAATPCRTVDPRRARNGLDLWFSPFKDKVFAVRACQSCPFLGRCGYNAVAGRETHGVWGGIALPGGKGKLEDLQASYERLLRQFERRRPVELPGFTGAVPMPSTEVRRRNTGDSPTDDDILRLRMQ